MQYYNAKDKFIMKGEIVAILGHNRGGARQHLEYLKTLGGASRRVRRVRSGGGASPGRLDLFGGGKRTFRKRTCRSKSRCGGGAWYRFYVPA